MTTGIIGVFNRYGSFYLHPACYTVVMESSYASIADLFGNRQFVKKGRRTERGDLVSFFSNEMQREPRYIAFRLSHLTIPDLYYIKSVYTDTQRRNGNVSAIKYLWAITRTELSTSTINRKGVS
jgi:hypothetical protein